RAPLALARSRSPRPEPRAAASRALSRAASVDAGVALARADGHAQRVQRLELAGRARAPSPRQGVLDRQKARAAQGGPARVHAEVLAAGFDEAPLRRAVDDARRLAAEQREGEAEQGQQAGLHARRVT